MNFPTTILAHRDAIYVNCGWTIERRPPTPDEPNYRPVVITVGRTSIELDPTHSADRYQLTDMAAALTSVLNGGA